MTLLCLEPPRREMNFEFSAPAPSPPTDVGMLVMPSGMCVQVYSAHAFVGTLTLFMLSGQYIVGFGAHVILRDRMSPELRQTVAGWHAFFGKATFFGGIMSCIVGASLPACSSCIYAFVYPAPSSLVFLTD